MAAQRVVSLNPKPKATGPTEHFVRLSRGENGCGFLVGYVDGNGVEDFRTQEEFSDYDAALRAANSKAHTVRRPMRDDTGVEAAPEPAATKTKAIATSVGGDWAAYRKAANAEPGATLYDFFNLPDVESRMDALDLEQIAADSVELFKSMRGDCAAEHDARHGDSANHPVIYSQRTHSLIQEQLRGLHLKATGDKALLLTFLELAFERIEQLETNARGLSYEGVWTAEREYSRGMFATHGGNLWHAERTTTNKPGEGDHKDWILAVRKGRDAKQCAN